MPMEMQHYRKNASQMIHVDLPDPQFQRSMDAQRSHLMMGLISEKRDRAIPVFFRAWQRPGAYITSALTRAGDPNVGWVLSRFLATHDFAGGADRKPTHRVWRSGPHGVGGIHRGSPSAINGSGRTYPENLTDRGHAARARTSHGAICRTVPYDLLHGQQPRMALLAKPAREGVIVGRIGKSLAVAYVNAVSYRGLLAGAEFANDSANIAKQPHGKTRPESCWRPGNAET